MRDVDVDVFPKLPALHNPQISNLLSMFSLHQRFTFLLRTVPTAAVMSAAVSTDSALLASFREINDITEAELPAGSLRARQAALAARDGGFGGRRTTAGHGGGGFRGVGDG